MRSRLPHWQKNEAAYSLTWRLHGSLPAIAVGDRLTSEGAKFLKEDRLLDVAATGPRWLVDPAIAAAVINTLSQGQERGLYELGPWVLMPNHVHLILRPKVDLPKAVSWIKGLKRKRCQSSDRLGRSKLLGARLF